MSLPDAQGQLERLVEHVDRDGARILVERDGTPVAAIVSAADLERLAQLDDQDRAASAVLAAMRAPFAETPPDEIELEAERAVAAVRIDQRARERHAS
jgi:prevent-host-death family protein